MAVRPTPCLEQTTAPGAKTLVVGLGNPWRGDDSIGLHVAQQLRSRLARWPGVEVAEDYCGGLRLMERMIGFDRAIVVDAIASGAAPGTVQLLGLAALATRHSASAHDVDFGTALAVGRRAGAVLPAPEDIRVVAIEAADCLIFEEQCTPAVAASIGRATEAVVALLAAWR
jgi:hydrogenase maturation protease